MTRLQRTAALVSAAVLAAALGLVAPALLAPAQASTSEAGTGTAPAQRSTYSPGTATAQAPTFENEFHDYMRYQCIYREWRAGVKVTWHCNLYDRHFCDTCAPGHGLEYSLIKAHSGTWTPPQSTHSSGTFRDRYNFEVNGNWCTEAWATSADGGSTHDWACHP